MNHRLGKGILSAMLVMLISGVAFAERVKDIAQVVGARSNQLVGYGIVVGLNSTGDGPKSEFTLQSVAAMLRRLGVLVDPGTIKLKNAAAVIVTADIPAFMKPGQQLDVVVSSLGDAKSLKGGTLIQTPLRGADREVYAVAQGQLSIGGYSASGGGSSKVVNHTTVGRIPRGAIVEKEIHTVIEKADSVQLSLNSADAVTASRMVEVINAALQGPYASAKDPGLVAVSIPKEYSGRTVEFLSYLSSLEVERDVSARVIINERTGTVVVGAAVTLRPVAIAHGGITVEIGRSSTVSQPPPFSIGGSTIVTNDTELVAGTLPGNLHLIPQTATVADLVSALNAMGVKPNDLIVIFQALASAGAMSAELMIQ